MTKSEYGYTVSDGKSFPFNPAERNADNQAAAELAARAFLLANPQYASAELFRLDFDGCDLVGDAILGEIPGPTDT